MKKILVLLVLFACVAVYAQKKVTVHVAYSEEVSMDASLSADCWQKAQKYPLHLCKYNMRDWPQSKRKNVGNKLRNPGYVQFLWNEKNLYIGVMMEDADFLPFHATASGAAPSPGTTATKVCPAVPCDCAISSPAA